MATGCREDEGEMEGGCRRWPWRRMERWRGKALVGATGGWGDGGEIAGGGGRWGKGRATGCREERSGRTGRGARNFLAKVFRVWRESVTFAG